MVDLEICYQQEKVDGLKPSTTHISPLFKASILILKQLFSNFMSKKKIKWEKGNPIKDL